ncbi:MAG: radical SAM protein [Lachnospiraceae bacterium]|nr:radical SAM protein [Lachnospiraceae bacterium]
MYIARILYPVKVLGPGNRLGLWFSGCEHHCFGCSNPELWEQKEKHNISLEGLMKLLKPICDNYNVDGFTLTGGDPFFQPNALRELLPCLHMISDDILVYTGYRYEELTGRYKDILRDISVIIDGQYVEAENHGTILKGSDNQRIIYLNRLFEARYNEYLSHENSRIQNFTTQDGIISVGIHLPEYEDRLRIITQKKGLEEA